MKFTTCLLLLLTFSLISVDICSALTRSHRYRRSRRTREVNPAQNKWAQMCIGIVIGASGKGDAEIKGLNECLPDNWKIKETNPIRDESTVDQPKSLWTKILDGVEKVIKFVCAFKSHILKLFGMRLRRNKYRMLITANAFRKNIFKDLKDKVFSTIKAGVDWAKEKFDKYVGEAKKIVENLKIFVQAVKDKIKAFLASDTVQTIIKWLKCLSNGAKIAVGLKDIVVGLISKITTIGSIAGGNYAGVAKIIVDLVCNFPIFRQAFTTLADAIEEKKDVIRKFSLVGRFIGYLARAIITRRRTN